eukprot:9948963-Lingulodinium_polyedra.AAC.1
MAPPEPNAQCGGRRCRAFTNLASSTSRCEPSFFPTQKNDTLPRIRETCVRSPSLRSRSKKSRRAA